MTENKEPLMVSIRCITYNHEPFIRQCLEGFVMQKTNFRFEAIVHDDASTDGTAAIIREYAEKYPDIIKPIYETENQWSKHDGSLRRIMDEACKGKYTAYCEGDDYWIDPLKLQKQVDFLENHPDFCMCWTDAYVETHGNRSPYNRYKNDCVSPIKDIIEEGGMFIPTCSIVALTSTLMSRPERTKRLHVGDYPMQIMCAYYGKVYYFAAQTCVYRSLSEGSWSSRLAKTNKDEQIDYIKKEEFLLKVLDEETGFKYHSIFERRRVKFLYFRYLSVNKRKARALIPLLFKYRIKVGIRTLLWTLKW